MGFDTLLDHFLCCVLPLPSGVDHDALVLTYPELAVVVVVVDIYFGVQSIT